MTATFDAMTDTDQTDVPKALEARALFTAYGRKIAGGALLLAGLGLWLEPGAHVDTDLILMKLGLSLTFGFAGLALMQTHNAPSGQEVEIDTVRREVRLIRSHGRKRAVTRRTAIRDLGRAEEIGETVRLSAANGDFLAEVSLADAAVRSSLCGALRDAGKL
ncbi:hypothetical protein [uncultured Tateyamaria sp.]|uniref:hypothetical protein n=1 Tax=uncultured Tateyamaria sp. TaxID=455651 RepID=UPI00262F92A5|nr:hypothetical protein [uncultured Tateyamaria sp.]